MSRIFNGIPIQQTYLSKIIYQKATDHFVLIQYLNDREGYGHWNHFVLSNQMFKIGMVFFIYPIRPNYLSKKI
jgi:hypothetical protein